MAAKLLHSLTDDNLDLQKQIGCMNGIFQLFDRHHVLTKRGISDFNGDETLERESSNGHLRSPSLERKYSPRNQERQRSCSESLSRSSSSFSSVDCNRSSQLDRIIFPETPSKESGRDLRDLVKDSMYREIQGLEPALMKHRNSVGVPVSKLQEPAWYSDHEPRALLRSSSYHHSKDGRDIAPRFSYDGRAEVVNRAPFDPMDHVSKSTLKLKDLPRLSLDSKAGSMRSLHAEYSKPMELDNLQGNQARPPSVVAKLMGLETLPDSSRTYQERGPSLISSNKLWKEPSSPRWRNPDSSIKRFPIEPAPWKQIDGRRSSQKPVSGTKRPQIPSVYSEIEKRLKDLEFTQSGKDLRALKQILEAMQSKGLFLQTQKEIPPSNFICDDQPRWSTTSRSVDRPRPQCEQVGASTKRKPMIESPIVIMKPAKLFDGFVDNRKGLGSGTTARDPSSKSSRTVRTATRPQQIGKDGNGKSSGSISPRLQQKKLELEKRSRPPTPPDSSKCRRQPNKQQVEAHSPGRRRRAKHPNIQDNEVSVHSNALEVTLGKSSDCMLSGFVEKNSSLALCEEESAEFGSVPLEYSSPVSVLDDIVHKDDSPSHVTYTRKSIKVSVDKSRDYSDANCGSSTDSYISKEFDSTSNMNRNKLENIEKLVEKLKRLNSTHDEARTDYIASLCENTVDPDHRYVSEILLASGLLGSNLINFKFHQSGHPINPDLFLVLEQTKSSSTQPQTGKIHRKLIFHTVNEILARKLGGPLRHELNAQRLLRELCCEIELLQGKNSSKWSSNEEDDERWKNILYEDVMHHSSERWISFDDEMSGAVLDIERSMFKDLVDEIVIGEFAGLKTRTAAAGRPRLFHL